jgi:hypothetical protein
MCTTYLQYIKLLQFFQKLNKIVARKQSGKSKRLCKFVSEEGEEGEKVGGIEGGERRGWDRGYHVQKSSIVHFFCCSCSAISEENDIVIFHKRISRRCFTT